MNMFSINFKFCLLLIIFPLISHSTYVDPLSSKKVLVAITLQNNESSLENFFSMLKKLSYLKSKMDLYFVIYPSVDRTNDSLDEWLEKHKKEYNLVTKKKEVYKHMGNVEVMRTAWTLGVDYVWFLDPGLFFIDENILQRLISKDVTAIAPMLKSTSKYSNFGDESQEKYNSILSGRNVGCHPVSELTRGYLLNLRKNDSPHLTFNPALHPEYNGTKTETGILTYSAKKNNIDLNIWNGHQFGFLLQKLPGNVNLEEKLRQMHDVKNLIHTEYKSIFKTDKHSTQLDDIGIDKVFVINLDRRPIKKQIMQEKLLNAGLEPTFVEAVDGEDLNIASLQRLRVAPLEDYDEQYLTYGTVGTFLSHYLIWEEVIQQKYDKVLIFEDETEFPFGFRTLLKTVLQEPSTQESKWDIITLDNNTACDDPLIDINVDRTLARLEGAPSTIGYLLSLNGAQKLMSPNPLKQMIPLKEYLAIKYGVERRPEWQHKLCPCELNAFTVHPRMIRSFYSATGFNRYADTANSPQIENELFGPRVTEAEYKIPFCED